MAAGLKHYIKGSGAHEIEEDETAKLLRVPLVQKKWERMKSRARESIGRIFLGTQAVFEETEEALLGILVSGCKLYKLGAYSL